MTNTHRTSVYIDNSNVFKMIQSANQSLPRDVKWPKAYNPLYMAKVLNGPRVLVNTHFYCTPPPEYLKTKFTPEGNKLYWVQLSYFEAIKKLPNVDLKYGYLTGPPEDLHEKNLDSQIVTDMLTGAFKNEFDTAILVAGDGDYMSVVRSVKDIGKRVELVYFKGHGSMALMQECDLTRRIRKSMFQQLPFSYNELP